MAAPKGNDFWKKRLLIGAEPKFKDPSELAEVCRKYFEWVEDNPLIENKFFSYQGEGFTHPVEKMRAMTIKGLCIHACMASATWDVYREKEAYAGIVKAAEQIMYTQKFEGASADLFNSSIIARDLGLAEKSVIENINPVKEAKTEYIDADTIT
jgi:hypothetical protein